jgi:hypothetical protein
MSRRWFWRWSGDAPFYSCDGRMVVFGSENTNRSILATPLQSHYRERAVPGEAHSLLDGVIPGAVVAVSSSDQEPVNAVEHCYRDLALPQPCGSPLSQRSVSCSFIDRDFELSVRIGCEEQKVRVRPLARGWFDPLPIYTRSMRKQLGR